MPPVLITNACPVATRTRIPISGVRVESVPCEKNSLVTKTCETNSSRITTTPVMTIVGVTRIVPRLRAAALSIVLPVISR